MREIDPAAEAEKLAASRADPPVLIEQTARGSLIRWQDVPRAYTGGLLIADTPETLLPYLIRRLEVLNADVPAPETTEAIEQLRAAARALASRRRDRDNRSVTGTYEP